MASEHGHVMVLRFSSMGDVAMIVPVLRLVLATYPTLKITVVTRSFFQPFFEPIERVSVCVAKLDKDHKGILGLYRLAKVLKQNNPTAVADLHNVIRSKITRFFLGISGIAVGILDKGRTEKKEMIYSKQVQPSLKAMHYRYADVFSSLGFPIDLESYSLQKLCPKIEEKTLSLLHPKNKNIGLAPFAQYPGKCYPDKELSSLLAALSTISDFQIFLFGGGKKEQEQLEKLAKPHPNICNTVGRLPFEQELALIAQMDCMVAMDSGNGHIAAMYHVPTITMWGVTHPSLGFSPFQQPETNSILSDSDRYPEIPTSVYGNKVPEGYETVMSSIAPNEVIAKIQEILKKTKT